MQRLYLVLLLTTFSTFSFSQTASETREWLKFNLSKYYGDEYLFKVNQLKNDYFKANNNIVYWKSYEFEFKDNLFNIVTHSYKKDIKSGEQQSIGNKKTTINLRFVTKIENDSKIDTSRFYTAFVDASKFSLRFNFKPAEAENSTFNQQSIKEYDLDLNKDITPSTTYYLNYNFNVFTSFDNFQNDIPNRIVKALEHLVIIYGGPLIKDVF